MSDYRSDTAKRFLEPNYPSETSFLQKTNSNFKNRPFFLKSGSIFEDLILLDIDFDQGHFWHFSIFPVYSAQYSYTHQKVCRMQSGLQICLFRKELEEMSAN